MEEIQHTNIKQPHKKVKQPKRKLKMWVKILLLIIVWLALFTPYILLRTMLNVADDGNLPGFEQLENPESSIASVIYSEDGKEIGKYFLQNRTNADFNELSPYLVQALIATEDERFHQHSGVDVRATGRVIKGVLTGNSKGGGSTISQQLAKMLFPRKPNMSKLDLVKRKFKEWIIAARLEKGYTKDEIIAMYFNQFDFLNNAVGINSAAMVYFGKKPLDLELHEAAMLVGMAKNPSLFNPLRKADTTLHRRSVVFFQMKKSNFITQTQYDSLIKLPLDLNYTRVDHQTGLAPYFRETLRSDVTRLLKSKDKNGDYIIHKANGEKYSIYQDGLKIYTTLDSRMQEYAEYGAQEHLKHELQAAFFKNNKKWKNPPFSNDLKQDQIDGIMASAMHKSQMYKKLTGKVCSNCERPKKWLKEIDGHYHCEYCHHDEPVRTEEEIVALFNVKRKMKVFDWQAPNYEKDTVFTAMDSIRYYKEILRTSLISINPHNGHVKAWVGGPYFKHFKYDAAKKGKRQVGSTFKPFVYATALEVGAITPCLNVPDIQHCVEIPYNAKRNKMWCPGNAGSKFTGAPTPIPYALASSMNNITTYVIGLQSGDNVNGSGTMPKLVFDRVAQLGIDTSRFDPVPSMALGVFDLSVFEMVSAMTAFVNDGIYVEPVYLTRIEDKNGNVIFSAEQEITQVWSPNTAYTMLSIMKRTTLGIQHPTLKNKKTGRPLVGGTAMRIRGKQTERRPYAGLKMPIAAKTGTTQNQSDGWFMGLTPDLVTGVWVGAEDRAVRFRSLQLGMGTNMALPIWAYYMHKVYEDSTLNISQGDFDKPASVIGDPLNCMMDSKSMLNYEFDESSGDGLNWGATDTIYQEDSSTDGYWDE